MTPKQLFTSDDYFNNTCSTQEWINQHKPIKLEVGKIYISRENHWSETHYKIISSDGYIATAVKVYDAIYKQHKQTKEYDLFYVENGFRYHDIIRPEYRLTKERHGIINEKI